MRPIAAVLFSVGVFAPATSGAPTPQSVSRGYSIPLVDLAEESHRQIVARSQQVAQEPTTLRILAYNIHHGAGNDEVLDLERIAELIRSLDPDLVALQEVDNRTERTGGVA